MNETLKYTFKSITGNTVVVKTKMGEDSARSAAMLHFWGPPSGWCENKGEGLVLESVTKDVEP